ncbi:MAG: bifunctional hydroxymethylpyrimidine kinase/phosphomethylpyrimidine kinase, partial [Gemmatimonadaceae bacterium]
SPYILDPVMVSTTGAPLLDGDAVDAIRDRLCPLAELVTPNADEARMLTGITARDVESMTECARRLAGFGAAAVLVKGGHLAGAETTDVLFDGTDVTVFRHTRIDTPHTHGTGCTLSAAIAAHRALGVALHDAVSRSLDYVHRAIATAPGLGSGNGPLNHSA